MTKKIYFIIILIFALVALLYYFFVGHFSYYAGQQVLEQIAPTSAPPNFTPAPTQISGADFWRNVKTYYNKKYSYSLEYNALDDIFDETPENACFGDAKIQFGSICVRIVPTSFLNPDEWLKQKNSDFQKRFEKEGGILIQQFLEKRIKIAGYDAIVTYHGSSIEQFPNEKETVFVKDRNIYVISTPYTPEPERLWNSFRFDK